jgi:YVTN family beta-propeller protein
MMFNGRRRGLTGGDEMIRNVCSNSHGNRGVGLLPFVLALLLGATTGHSQWLETKIILPDSLGGALGPYCLTTDTSERYVYIADASGFVYVVDAATRTRVAKLSCGTVSAICTSTRRNRVYAADCVGNQIFAISCATNQVVATIPTGACPLALCYNSTGDKVYSADTSGHDLTVIDCSCDGVLKTIPLGESPAELCYNSASNRLFCTAALPPELANELLVIDGAGDSVVAVRPDTWVSPMVVAAAVNKVYASTVSYSNGCFLKALDGTTGVVLDSLNICADLMCFNSRTQRLYTCDNEAQFGVRVFDCTADTQIRRIWLNDNSMFSMACETTTGRIYASCEYHGQGVLEVIDGIGDTLIARIAGPDRGELLASSKWRCMYSTDHNGPELAVYDLGADSLLRTIMLGGYVDAMCYDSTDDKVCYAAFGVLGEVGSIDASTNQPVGHVQIGQYPLSIIWHAPTDRVYCGGSKDITVIDPTADTVTKVLPVQGRMLCSAPRVNKVYAVYLDIGSREDELAVIDCRNDSVVKTIPMSTNTVWSMCNVSTADYDKLYISTYGALLIVDCTADTLVRSYSSSYSYVVAGCDGKRVHWATMDSLCTFDPAGDTLVASVPWDVYDIGNLFYVPDADKVYCSCRAGGQDWILVADGATDSVIAQIPLQGAASLCYDAASKLVYIGCWPDPTITSVDSRTDSVVGLLNSQVNPAVFTMASPHHRLYVGPWSGTIQSSSMPVIRTDPPGVEDAANVEMRATNRGATIVRGVLFLPSTPLTPHRSLLSADGRKVLDLHAGANDVRALAPGVYFVREAQAVRKIILTE